MPDAAGVVVAGVEEAAPPKGDGFDALPKRLPPLDCPPAAAPPAVEVPPNEKPAPVVDVPAPAPNRPPEAGAVVDGVLEAPDAAGVPNVKGVDISNLVKELASQVSAWNPLKLRKARPA